jgi:hypothetical protein
MLPNIPYEQRAHLHRDGSLKPRTMSEPVLVVIQVLPRSIPGGKLAGE